MFKFRSGTNECEARKTQDENNDTNRQCQSIATWG